MGKSTKRQEIEATAGNAATAFLIMDGVAERQGFFIQNNTTTDLYLFVGEDTNPDGTNVTAVISFSLRPGSIFESPIWLRGHQVKGKFGAADAAKFSNITEVY